MASILRPMRLAPLLAVLVGCVPQTSRAPAPAPSTARARPSNTPTYAANVLVWLEKAETGADCPMSIVEARQTRWATTKGRGDAEYWLNRVACLCDVVDRGAGLEFDACGVDPSPSVARDGASEEALRMLSWENLLVAKIRDGASPDQLVRSTPLAVQLKEVRKTLAETGDPESEHWNELQKAIERVRTDVASDTACLLEEDLVAVKLHLKNHEKLDLGGMKSKAGRQLLAEAEQLVKPLRTRMRACKLEKERE